MPDARRVGLIDALLAAVLVVGLVGAPVASAQRRRAAPPQQQTQAQTPPAQVEPVVDPATLERARQLFEQGLASLARERWDEARILFEEAWQLSPRPSILVNLGTAQRQSGLLVEARDSYRLFLERFPTHELAEQTRASLANVEELMPELTIHVEGRQEGDEVFLDEQPAPALDRAFATNPGLRSVSLWRGGRALQTVRVRVELEGEEEVFLRAIDTHADTVVVGEQPAVTPPHGDDTPLIVGLVIGGVLIVAGGVTTGVLVGMESGGARQPTLPTIASGVITFE